MKHIRSLLVMIILFIPSMIIYHFVGFKVMIWIWAFALGLLGLLFLIKKDFYYSYYKFINPWAYNALMDKSDEYREKSRKGLGITNIVLSIVFIFDGFVMADNVLDIWFTNKGNLFTFVIIMLVMSLVGIIAGEKIRKVSKTYNQELGYSIGVGCLIGIIVLAVIIFAIARILI